MRRVPRRLRDVASVTVAMASFAVSATPGAASAAVYGRPSDATSSVSLPVIPSALPSGHSCTSASPTEAHAQPWTVSTLSLSQVRALGQGAGITVGVVDTGVAVNAPALTGRVDVVGGAGTDCVGHGTFAAGLIAGSADEATGGGLAPQARILAVAGTTRTGTASPASMAAGIRSAADHGAQVVYVGAALATGRPELTAAVLYAARKDALVVAPAAPDPAPASTSSMGGAVAAAPPARPYFPAFIPQVVAVEDFGPDGTRPSGSPGVFAADLAAPGDAVVSIGPKGTGDYIGSGASLAAASVAGAAAVVRAYQPRLTAAEVASRLVTSAYPAARPVLDPYAAVSAVAAPPAARPGSAVFAVRMPTRSHASHTRALVVASAGAILVALVVAAAVIVPLGRARHWRPAR